MPRPAVEVERLAVRYGRRSAVDGVDLEVGPGEVVALLGRNGAGKTSTVETLEGYRRRSGGRVTVLGLDPGRPADHRRLSARIGVMLQEGGVYPGMGPREALQLFARYYDAPLDPAGLLERLGLGGVAATPWRRLSGGEKQRLSLALALVGRPEVLFLDEPTAGVDPAGRVTIRAVIEDVKGTGVAVLLTTHELDEAERVADRIVIIDSGRVVAAGTVAELTVARSGHPGIRFAAPPGLDVDSLAAAAGGRVREREPGQYEVEVEGSPADVAAVTAWMAARNLAVRELRTGNRLEEVFLSLTGGDG